MDDAADDPAELLQALPEAREGITSAWSDDDLGLRSLLERPEAFSHAWWRDQARQGSSRRASRRRGPGRAASI